MANERLPLSRDRILDAAIAMVDEHGLQALTMRRLGSALEVEAMSLYRYVPSRDDLLDGMLVQVFSRLAVDEAINGGARYGWQEYMQRLAHAVRSLALAHPKLFPLVASRPPEAPWLRPPLRDLRLVESFLSVLSQHGFDDQRSAHTYRAYTSFLLGHLLLEVAALGAQITPEDDPELEEESETDEAALKEFPVLERLSPLLTEDHSVDEFEEALEQLLDRLAVG